MGVVYEAEQVSLGRRVAVKVLPGAGVLDPRRLQRFQIEAQAAAQLHHPHIVPIFAVGCDRGIHFYAMQFVEGRTLAADPRESPRRRRERRRGHPVVPGGDGRFPARPRPTGPRRPKCPPPIAGRERLPPHAVGLRAEPHALREPGRLPGDRPARGPGGRGAWTMPTAWASSTATSSRRTC